MKVASREIAGFLKAPRAGVRAILLYGPEPMRTALIRQDFLKDHLGPGAEEEMRLTRMTGAELRSDAAALQDAMKAIGFFPGARAVLVTDAGDAIAPILEAALHSAGPDDAMVVIEAGNLGKGSKLRKLAEGAAGAAAIAIYPDPPSRASVEERIAAAGLGGATEDAKAALMELAMTCDPGDFRQILEKAALYAGKEPLTAQGVAAIAPATTDAGVDALVADLADCKVRALGPAMRRMAQQGGTPTGLVIAATRHFRQLHAAASHPRGPEAGMGALRPPVFGPRRDRMGRQARHWGRDNLEQALGQLFETDLQLRSSSNAPQWALTERAFIRIAMIPR